MSPIETFLARLENIDLPDEVKMDFVAMMTTLQTIGDVDGLTKLDTQLIHNEKVCGDAEECGNDFLYAVIDQRDIHSRHRKWYVPSTLIGDRSGSTRLTKKTGFGFHNTAVFEGFGAWKSQVTKHKEVAAAQNWIVFDAGLSSPPIVDPDSSAYSKWSIRPNQVLLLDEWARAMALGDRYRGFPEQDHNTGTPYHAILGPNSVLYLNLPFDWVTWHGNSLNNDFLGVAWDALSTKQSINDGLAVDLIHDVIRLVALARAEGHPIEFFDVHATRTNKPNDPGAEFIREVMMPAAEETGCTLIMDKARDGGRTINKILAA